jgi:hypothetical protein
MVLVKVLERKDAASLVVAIAGGLIVGQLLLQLSNSLIDWVLDTGTTFTFKDSIVQPVLTFLLAFVLLEGLVRLVIAARGNVGK